MAAPLVDSQMPALLMILSNQAHIGGHTRRDALQPFPISARDPIEAQMKFLPFLYRAGKKIVRHPAEAMLPLRMAGWVCVLSLAVKLRPLPRALAMLSAKTKRPSGQSAEEIETRLAHALDPLLATGLFCFRPICWKRAAVLHRYLALNGIATQIVFGMRKETDGALSGHAWLEAEGKPILEHAVPDYIVTYTFPSSDRFEIDLASLAGDFD